ncbi:translation initiation factor IF-2 [Mycoplasma bradburyae]|uniref:Translation initiation factor IF-2 n=1 Tax=Mycoplasma bradburyae TaxID=2963128 RepID=A0AAW6HRY6_9MOLU|nr:translation initiation factor IF-2 [Mycoplasma bradburyae]MDC4181730.1 translation initiation factor IF-2 [Mycoplasma bradburyae]MDC4182437.1 translation initiation factor IF-2 [Mycoplasma bradburyae]MDC4183656.1 translation initiation factor IF-2 [Mycoplasma bradburyae]MDC4183903.1 translation initiation factor IF-2 [Mycoplasma bradburyae]UTS70224.1 translation initiation factor IF-2 [Mycoplasma bradburyae]
MNKKPAKNKKPFDKRSKINIKSYLKEVKVGVQDGVFIYTDPLSIDQFAKKINQPVAKIIKYFFAKGINTINLNTILSLEQIGELCLEFGLDFKIEKEVTNENILDNIEFKDKKEDLVKRPAIVTVMGHVDHGKTSLLDAIRSTNVTSGEAGGITQHIGAYQVKKNNELITFIDTPGHEAFTEMRARGANITDIVVLVVAGDDGIKPQTEEAIDHAKNAGVPIIVFVNKMDKPSANYERVVQQISKYDLSPEDYGGDTIFVQGSALKNEGINELLDSILTLAEINEYKANPNADPYGIVVESKLVSGLGPQATVIIKRGTLKVGDYICIGAAFGKVRLMQDEKGNNITEATPSTPVKISGLDNVPVAGEKFLGLATEKEAKELSESYKIKQQKQKHLSLQESHEKRTRVNTDGLKCIDLIIKSDVQGSLEAIKYAISNINIEGVTTNIIRASTGAISETDIKLAQASNSTVISFNLAVSKQIKDLASSSNIEILSYEIIYKMVEDLEKIMKGELDPVFEEQDLGQAIVRAIWKHSKIGTIAGSYVQSGKVVKNGLCRIIRDGVIIYKSKIGSLKVKENFADKVENNKECGIVVENYNDIKENDIIEVYEIVKKRVQ